MLATTEPYPACENDAPQNNTETVRERLNFTVDAAPYPLCNYFRFKEERAQAEESACRWKNPLGSCWLGDVRGTIQLAREVVA